MKFNLIGLLLYSSISFAQIIEFQPSNSIKASEVNSNFNYIKALLAQKNTIINFNQFQSGALIVHSDLEDELDKVRTLGISVSTLTNHKIMSEELNVVFTEMNDGIVVYDDIPVATNSSFSLNESSVLLDDLNFTNVVGPSIVSLVTEPSNGIFQYLGNKQFKYTPTQYYNGSDSFSYSISDGINSSTATVSINILSINDAPFSQPQNISLNEDTSKEITLFGSDIEGSALSFTITSNPTNGVITKIGDKVTYIPNLNYFGSDSFSYKVNDGELDSSVSVISLNIIAVNDAPIISGNQSISLAQNTAMNGTVSASDVDSPSLTYSVSTPAVKGTVVVNQLGQYSYSTLSNTYGTDSFAIRVSDGLLSSDLVISVDITGSGLLLVSGAKNYVDGTYAKSCSEYYTKNSGIYTYTNGGDGNYRILIGSTVHTVYCDMTNQGWTLISSGGSHCPTFNQIAPTTALSVTATAGCGYMSRDNVKILAGNTASVKLTTGRAAVITEYQVISSGALTMSALRNNTHWHNGAKNEFSTTAGWCWGPYTGPSASSWPNMYHSTDYAGCVHWLASLKHGRTYAVDGYSSTWLK